MAFSTVFRDDFVGAAATLIGRAATGGTWITNPNADNAASTDGSGFAVGASGGGTQTYGAKVSIGALSMPDRYAIEFKLREVQQFGPAFSLELFTAAVGGDDVLITLLYAGTTDQCNVSVSNTNGLGGGNLTSGVDCTVGVDTTVRYEVDSNANTGKIYVNGSLVHTHSLADPVFGTVELEWRLSATGGTPRTKVEYIAFETEVLAPPVPFWTDFVNTREVL